MSVTPSNIVTLLCQEFGSTTPTAYTREELRLCGELVRILKNAAVDEFDMESYEETSLVEQDEHDEDFIPEEYEEDDVPEMSTNITFGGTMIPVDRVKEALKYYRSTKKGSRSLESMNRSFTFIKKESDLRKLREFEKDGEELKLYRSTAFKKISDLLTVEVNRLQDQGLIFHDINLRQLAMKINMEHKFMIGFKASHRWIQTFKRNYGLVSRRITKFYSIKNYANKDQIDDAGKKFVEAVRQDMQRFPRVLFCNADQSGFLKEIHTARTLAPVGIKKVEKVVQSNAAITHSYTVMPILYSNGTLGEKLFIQLQEPGGVFPTRNPIYQAPNIEVRAGSSHIMTKNTMKEWISSCLFAPSSPDCQYLIVDSWSSFKDHRTIMHLVPPNKQLKVVNIPAGATGMIQPLDVYFFRPFKDMVKHITDYIRVHDINITISKRDNILKMASLVYHQFCSPCFQPFLQYSWYKSGYLDNHPGPFETPVQRCFSITSGASCSSPNCLDTKFIQCARCSRNLCFSHFFVDAHYC